jgi:hypothetical protein
LFINNLYSLLIHLCFTIIIITNYLLFGNVNEMYGGNYLIYPLINIAAILIYLWVGSKLANQGSKFKNLLSVSAISLIGFFMWLVCYYMVATHTNDRGLGFTGPEILWWLYFFYNHLPITFMVYDQFGIKTDALYFPYFVFIFNLLPSFLFWLGLQRGSAR